MLQIAVCDDDPREIAQITACLEQFKKQCGAPLAYQTFCSAAEMLAAAKKHAFSLFLLDVMMPGVNGLDAAREIRSFDTEAKLVFLTSSAEYALLSYSVKALDYMLKPVDPQHLFAVLQTLRAEAENTQEGFAVKTKSGLARILFERLAAVEVMYKKVYFYMTDGTVREVSSSLSEFEPLLLQRPQFIRVHRSYLVNLDQINELSAANIVTYQGKNIPVSRALYPQVRSAYRRQLFCEKEG